MTTILAVPIALLFGVIAGQDNETPASRVFSSTSVGLIAFNSDRSGNDEIWVVDTNGDSFAQVTTNTVDDYWPTWSSDGARIAYGSVHGGNWDIYVIDSDGTNLERLTHHAAYDREPAWSPDGGSIAFESGRDGNPEIYIMNADGTEESRITNHAAVDVYVHWSPDGLKMVFCSNRDGNFEIYSMDADGSNQTRLTNNNSQDWTPKWSPNGDKIAFVAERDGNREIYVMDPDGGNQQRTTNHLANDYEPDWSPDGSQMVFVSERGGNADIYVGYLSETNALSELNQLTTDGGTDRHPVWRHGIAVATQLKSYDGRWRGSGVELTWHMSEIGRDSEFHVIRSTEGKSGYRELDSSVLSHLGLSFSYVDNNCKPRSAHTYRVDVSDKEGRRTLFETEAIDIPGYSLMLNQNSPNPFNPRTKLTFTLPERSRISLSIFDVTGNRVAVLVDATLTEGLKEYEWSGEDANGDPVGSGVYFYRLRSGKTALTKKMILLK